VWLVEPSRGDAGRAVAGPLQVDVAGTVALERLAGLVELPAVELDDEAPVRPVAVDLVAGDGDVGGGEREGAVCAERQEPLLEV